MLVFQPRDSTVQIPRYWSKVDSETVTPAGKRVPIAVWRGSEASRAEAQAVAQEAAERLAARIRRGDRFPDRYAYAERPLREEILQEFPSATGQLEAAITRNAYGAMVLNTARVCFIDVDLPRPAGSIVQLVQHLLRRFRPPAPSAEAAALERLRQWLSTHRDWSVRVYRTRSGLRYLVTHALFTPGDAASEEAMEYLGSDPQYRQLCRAQNSFRARLSPKPWRCRIERPPVRFPWNNSDEERRMRAWEERYARETEQYATCALLEVLGNPHPHPVVKPVVDLHDQKTKTTSDLPLA